MIAPTRTVNFFIEGAIMQKYITEEAWGKIFVFLKESKVYCKNEQSCRLFIEALFWIVRTGAQWRHLPERYGKWNTIFTRFNRWSKKEFFQELFSNFRENPDLEYHGCLIRKLCAKAPLKRRSL